MENKAFLEFDHPIVIIAMQRCGFIEEDFDPRTFYRFYTHLGQNNSHSYSLQQVNVNINQLHLAIDKIKKYGITIEEHAFVGYRPVDVKVIGHNHEKPERKFRTINDNRYRKVLEERDARTQALKDAMEAKDNQVARTINDRQLQQKNDQDNWRDYGDQVADRVRWAKQQQADKIAKLKQRLDDRDREKDRYIAGQKNQLRDKIQNQRDRQNELIDLHQRNKDDIEAAKQQKQLEKGGDAEKLMQKIVQRANDRLEDLKDKLKYNNDIIRQRAIDIDREKQRRIDDLAARTADKLADKFAYVDAQKQIQAEAVDRKTLNAKIADVTARMKVQRAQQQEDVRLRVEDKHRREADYMNILYKQREDLNEYWKAENEANMNHTLTMRDRFARQKEYRAWVQNMKQ